METRAMDAAKLLEFLPIETEARAARSGLSGYGDPTDPECGACLSIKLEPHWKPVRE